MKPTEPRVWSPAAADAHGITPWVKVKTQRAHFKVYGRAALEFLLWWRTMTPALPMVQFYGAPKGQRGSTFVPLHKGSRNAYARSQLIVSTNVPD